MKVPKDYISPIFMKNNLPVISNIMVTRYFTNVISLPKLVESLKAVFFGSEIRKVTRDNVTSQGSSPSFPQETTLKLQICAHYATA